MTLYRRRRWRGTDRALAVYVTTMLLLMLTCVGLMFGYLLVRAGVV